MGCCIASLKLQDAATSGNGSAVDLRGWGTEHTVYIDGTGTINAGAVQIETAKSTDYSGTWAALGDPVTVTSGASLLRSFTGTYRAMRARISTAIDGGGSVTVKLVSTE